MKSRHNPFRPLIIIGIFACLIGLLFIFDIPHRLRWWELGHYAKPTWSPDGSRVLYLFYESPDKDHLIVIDRSGYFPRTEILVGSLKAPAWRSNTEVSVFSEGYSGSGTRLRANPATLYLYDLTSAMLQSIETPLPIAADIAWQPDGNQALISFRDNPPFTDETIQPGIYKFTPDDKNFTLWRKAEWPGEIAWSPDGRYVAYFDLVTVKEEKHYQLNIVDTKTEYIIFVEPLSGASNELSWSVDGARGLSWSPNGKWLLVDGKVIKNPSSTLHYDVVSGFFFVPVSSPEQSEFWELSYNTVDFDWSPDGKEIVVTTVTAPWIGLNSLRVLQVPETHR